MTFAVRVAILASAMYFTLGMLLNIGGTARAPGWTILNIAPGPAVDIVADCTDLSAIPDDVCALVYASHVLEHLGYDKVLLTALREIRRVLMPGGKLMVSVPDLAVLCRHFIQPDLSDSERATLIQTIFGGRSDPYDVHLAGFDHNILGAYLAHAGSTDIRREGAFGLFADSSIVEFRGLPVSLNMSARKPPR